MTVTIVAGTEIKFRFDDSTTLEYRLTADDWPDRLVARIEQFARLDLGAAESRDSPLATHIESACRIMHDAYERAAAESGWKTNPQSRVPWAEVPESNKEAMRAAVRALLRWQGVHGA